MRRALPKNFLLLIFLLITITFFGLAEQDGQNKSNNKPQLLAGDYYRLNINNLNLPMNSQGVMADVNIDGLSGGLFDGKSVLYSGGFFMSGKTNGTFWSNAVASASRIEDYRKGTYATGSNDPRAQLYVIRQKDGDFAQSWIEWRDAVALGAYFYDGDNDGIYNPIDKNGNGKWDNDEDRPDLLGDETVWCVYSDNVDPSLRTFQDVQPQGIEIRQTVFAYASKGITGNIIFVRYNIVNTGLVADIIDSVYFGVWADPDLGDPYNDLVGCDTILNAGYVYNSGSDNIFGSSPPCFLIDFFQGPAAFIPGETFIDANNNGIYDAGEPALKTAYNYQGRVRGIENIPGAKNLGLTSFIHYQQSNPTLGDPSNKVEARNYMLGLSRYGEKIDPCTWTLGVVFGGVNCAQVNNKFWYSGDPVDYNGWLNVIPTDQRQMSNTGPFRLIKGVPVNIVVAYVVGRGTDALSSITEAKKNDMAAQSIFDSNLRAITLTSPKGGEFWRIGDKYNIAWTGDASDVKIEYSTDNGSTWSTIINSTPASAGSYSWTIPNKPSTECKVRVSDVNNGNINGINDKNFAITTEAVPAISINSPYGGEKWHMGTNQNITWSSGFIDNVKIEFSSDSGKTWSTVTASTSASPGSYSWSVPYIVSTKCKIRVSDATNPNVSSVTPKVFEIYQNLITLNTPGGGEDYAAGDSYSIYWASNNVANVKIELTTDDGNNWSTIIATTPSGPNTFFRTAAPNINSSLCRIRVSDVSNSGVQSTSPNTFRISPAYINTTYPIEGTSFMAGSSNYINWQSNVNSFRLEYTTNNGVSWSAVSDTVIKNRRYYNWKIPDVSSNLCKIRVSDSRNSSVNGVSKLFTIYRQPSITITSPIGGENWKVGSTNKITWAKVGVDFIKIDYSTNNGSDWLNIVASTASSSGYYSWSIPSTPSGQCRVRLSDVYNPTVYNISNNAFTITTDNLPSLSLISPVGGENWKEGSTHNISWTSSNLSNLKIEYSTNNGNDWTTIISSTPTSAFKRSYAWVIPSTPSNECRVRISNASNSSLNMVSANVFAIYQPALNITSPVGGEKFYIDSSYNITWSGNIDSINIAYSTDNGSSWNAIKDSMPAPGGSFNWRIPNTPSTQCKVRISDIGNSSFYCTSPDSFTIQISPTQILDYKILPEKFALKQNYPNPFNPSTLIEYDIPVGSQVSLIIYDILGSRVKTLSEGYQHAGRYRVVWDGKNDQNMSVSSGMFLMKLQSGDKTEIRKMLLVK